MPMAGFEPAIPVSWRPRNYALDSAVTEIGEIKNNTSSLYTRDCEYDKPELTVFRNMSPRSLVRVHRRFTWVYCLHIRTDADTARKFL
jgi:hypothetical protein